MFKRIHWKCLILGVSFILSGFAFADELTENDLEQVYKTMPKEQRAWLATIQSSVHKRITAAFTDEQGKALSQREQKRAFKKLYKQVLGELYGPNAKVTEERQALRLWLEEQGKRPISPFYGKTASVMRSLRKHNDPLFDAIHAASYGEQGHLAGNFSPMSYVVVWSLANAQGLPPLKYVGIIGMGSMVFASGCSTADIKKFWDDNKKAIFSIALEALRLYLKAEMSDRGFQDRLDATAEDFYTTVQEVSKLDNPFNEYSKRQLYAVLLDLVADFMVKYHSDQKFQEEQNEKAKKTKLPVGDSDSSSVGEDDEIKPDSENAELSLQLKAIWLQLKVLVLKYVKDEKLKNAITNVGEEGIVKITEFIQRTYNDYKDEWASIKKIMDQLNTLEATSSGVNGAPVNSSNRYYLKRTAYFNGLSKYVEDGKKAQSNIDGGGTSYGPPYRLKILTQEELNLLLNSPPEAFKAPLTEDEGVYIQKRLKENSAK